MGKKVLVFFTVLFLFSIDLTTATINTHQKQIDSKKIQAGDLVKRGDISSNQDWFENLYRLDVELDLIVKNKRWKRFGSWLKYNSDFIKNPYFQDKVINLIKLNVSNIADGNDLAYIYDQCFELYDKCAGNRDFVESYKQVNSLGEEQFFFWTYKFWVNGISIKTIGLDERQKKILFKNSPLDNRDVLSHFKRLYWKKGFYDIILEIPHFIENISVDIDSQKEKLRELLVKAYFKTKRYSRLSMLLEQRDWRERYGVTSEDKVMLQFRIALKRGNLNRAEKITRQMDKQNFHQIYNRSLFALGHRILLKKNYTKALGLYQMIDVKLLKEFQVEALKWNLFKIYRQLGKKKEIENLFEWSKQHSFSNQETASKFCYWGTTLDILQSSGSKNCSEKFPNTYYGLHFQKVSKEIPKPGLWKNIVRKDPVFSPNEKTFLKLMEQVYGEGKAKLGDFLITSYFNVNSRLSYFKEVGQVLVRHQRYYLLQRLIGIHYLGKVRKDAKENEKNGLLELYYPKAYKELISKYSRKYKVPEFLIYSVMREESRFKDEVVSGAGAIGLMQLMPKTAKYIAKRLRVKVKKKHLTRPETNIMLGSKYLSRLLKRFDGNLFYALAAYNGGPTNAKRWIKKYEGRDINQFIEEITFQETQNYVKRVMKSFYTYQLLYEVNKAS